MRWRFAFALCTVPALAVAAPVEYQTPAGQTAPGAVGMSVNGSNQAAPTSTTNPLPTAPVAGSNVIGKVGIDQTAPGTSNGVQINAPLPAGANTIGTVLPPPATGTGSLGPTTTSATIASLITNNATAGVWPASGNLVGVFTLKNSATSATTVAVCWKGGTCTCPSNGFSALTNGDEIEPGASWAKNLTGIAYNAPTIVACASGTDYVTVDQ